MCVPLCIFSVWEPRQDHLGDGVCRWWRALWLHQSEAGPWRGWGTQVLQADHLCSTLPARQRHCPQGSQTRKHTTGCKRRRQGRYQQEGGLFNPFSLGIDFWRQNLTSNVDPRKYICDACNVKNPFESIVCIKISRHHLGLTILTLIALNVL